MLILPPFSFLDSLFDGDETTVFLDVKGKCENVLDLFTFDLHK